MTQKTSHRALQVVTIFHLWSFGQLPFHLFFSSRSPVRNAKNSHFPHKRSISGWKETGFWLSLSKYLPLTFPRLYRRVNQSVQRERIQNSLSVFPGACRRYEPSPSPLFSTPSRFIESAARGGEGRGGPSFPPLQFLSAMKPSDQRMLGVVLVVVVVGGRWHYRVANPSERKMPHIQWKNASNGVFTT